MRYHDIDWTMIVLIASFSLSLLILTALAIAASPQLERAVLLSESVRNASPLDAAEALERHEDVRSYILADGELEGATVAEASHLRDVRRLVDILIGVALISLAFGIGALRRRDLAYRTIARRVSVTIITTIVAITAIALLLGFNSFFWNFHLLFFPQGNFTFPADSYLISLYPQVFFAHMAAWTGGLMIAIYAVIGILSRRESY